MKFDLKKLRRDLKEVLRWRNFWLYCVVILFFAVGWLIVHELGHTISALAMGARIEEFRIWLGYPGIWRGWILAEPLSGLSQDFVWLMGSVTTLIVSAVATACLIKCKLKKYAKAAVFVMSLYFLDMMFYSLFGVIENGKREALVGAMGIGIPGAVFLGVAWVITIVIITGIVYAMLRPYIKR